MREVEYFEDVRPKQITFITEPQQRVEATQQEFLKNIAAVKAEQAITTQQHMVDAASFLMREVELFEDVRPTIKAEQAKEVNKLVEMPTITKLISEEIQQHMVDTSHLILKEVELFEDVRPIISVPARVLIEQKSPEKQMVVENKELKQETETPKQEPSDSEKDTRSDSDTLESKPGFFSKFQFGGKSLDKDDSKDKEKQKKQKKKDRKSGGFFSRIGEKFSGGSQEIVDDLDQTVTVVKKDVKEKLEQTKGDVQSTIIEPKDIILSAKDVSAVKYKDTISAVKNSAKDKTENANDFFETKLQHEKHSIVTAADSTTEKLKYTSVDVKDISEKTGGFFSNLSKKLKDTTIETTDTVILAKDAAINKSKEKASEIKEAVKDNTYKAEIDKGDFGLKFDDTTLNDKDKFASGTVEIKDSVKYQTDKASEVLGDFTKKLDDTAQDIKASAIAASDSTVEELKEASVEIKDKVKETSEKTGGFFSSLGRKIKDTTTEPKDFVKDTTIDKTEQVGEALTNFGQKISGTASDSKDSFTEAKDTAAEKYSIVASDIEHTFKDKSEKVETILIDMSSNIQETFHEGKETSISAKDSAVQKVKDDSAEVKEKVKDSAEKTGGFFSGLGKKIKGGASKTNVLSPKDSTTEKLKEAKTDIKNTAANVVDAVKDKTGETLSDFSDQIKSKAVETIKSTVATEDTTIQVVKDTSVDITNKVKDSAEKTSGFFSGLGKKVEDTKIETPDSVASAVDLAIEKVNETKIDVIDSLKDKTELACEAISDINKQIGKMAEETKNFVTSATESAIHMVKDTVSDTKDKTFRAGVSLKDLGKETQESTHDKFVSAKYLSIDNTKGVTSEIIDTAEKSGGFFSSLGTATETKDTVVSAKVSAAATVNEKATNVRESAKQKSERASEALTEFQKKIDSSAYEGEESIVVAADLTVQQAKDTTSDLKEKVKDSAENAGGFFNHLGQAFKENVIEATDSTIGKAKDSTECFTDKSEKTSVGKKIEEDAYNKEDTIASAKDFVVSATDSTFDTLYDNAQPIKEKANDKTEKADKAGGFFSGLNKNIKGTTAETKDTIKSMKDSEKVSNAKIDLTNKAYETTHETKISAVTTMDAKIEKIKDTNSAVNEKVKESAEKTDGFFIGLGKIIRGTANETKDSVIIEKDSATEKIKETETVIKTTVETKTEKTDEALTDFRKKIDEKAQATKETIASTKDSGIAKIKQVKFDLEEFTQSKSDKTSVALHDLGKKVSEKTHDTKAAASDSANETLSESKTKVKETAEKTSGFFSNFGKKIKDTTTETKDSVAVAKVSATETIKDKVLEVKDAAKEKTEHVSEALSSFGSKIDDAAHDGTEKIVAAKDTSVQAVKVKSSDVKDKIKESSEKAGGFFSGLGRKIKGTATDIKVKMNETATGVKEIISDQTENAGTAISDSGELMKHSAHEHKQKLVSTSDACAEKLHDSASAVKDEVKTSVEQSEFFLSCLGHKTAETTVKSKDIIQSKASDFKKAVRDQSEKNSNVGSETGKNIGLFVHDTKENLVEAKDSILGRGNILGSEINSDVHDSAEATTGFFSALEQNLSDNTTQESEKAKESTSDAAEAITVETLSDLSQKIHQITVNGKDAVISAKTATAEQIKETSSSIESSVKDVPTECFSGLEAKVKDTSTQLEKRIVKTTDTTKDYILEVRDSSADNLKQIASEVADSLTSTKDSAVEKLEKAAIEIKKSATPHITKAEDTLAVFSQDKRSEVEDTSKDIAEKSEGFLKGLGKMFTGTATEVKDSVLRAKDSGAETVKEKASEVKEAANKKVEKAHDIVTNFGQKFGETAQDSKDSLVTAMDSTAPKFENTSSNVKDKVKETTEKAGGFISSLGGKFQATAVEATNIVITAKDSTLNKIDETSSVAKKTVEGKTEELGEELNGIGKMIKATAQSGKEKIVSTKDIAAAQTNDNALDTKDKIKDNSEKAESFFSSLGLKLKSSADETKHNIVAAKDVTADKLQKTATIVQETIKDTEKTTGFLEDLGTNLIDATHYAKDSVSEKAELTKAATSEKAEQVNDSTIEKVKDSSSEKFVKTSADITKIVAESTGKLSGVVSDLGQKVSDTAHDTKESIVSPKDPVSIKTETKILTNSIIEKADILVSDAKQSFVNTSDKIDAFDAKLGNVTNEAAEQIKQTTAQVHSSVKLPEKGKRKNKGKRSTENSGLPEKVLSPDAQIPGQASFTTKMSDYVCYVTTPTMQRRGIGGSQRLTKDERPAPLDVSNMPIDISSDEEEYIVTEPELQNNLNLDGELLSSSPLLIESLQGEITPERQISKDNEQSQELLDVKRRPLFHIGSKDEESGDWGDKSEKSEGMQSPVDLNMPELISTVKPEIKADIDLIENKLQELDRALGDLEKANIDLDANESASGLAPDVALEATESEDKIDRKLRRVERRFERMASETMEKDIKDAKEQQITSPEVEAKREEEFRTMVSQLSQDEVSECQRLYSTLWDEATFTPSEEWDSKTPDSQPDDIQDLPQESSGTTASGPAPSTLRDESTAEPGPETTESAEAQLRNVSDQHQLSSEMMQLLAEMEKHSKQ